MANNFRQMPKIGDNPTGFTSSNPNSSRQRRNYARRNAFNARKTEAEVPGSSNSWSYQSEVPDPSVQYNGPRRQTKRDKPAEQAVQVPPRTTKETPPKDEPLFDLPDMITVIPDQKYNMINLDHSGYVTLCEESYRHIVSKDSRMTRQITLGTYVHVMTEYLWARLFYLAQAFGIELPFDSERVWMMINADSVLIPQEIHEYLKAIGEFKDNFGNIWRPDLPSAVIPRAATTNTRGGTFPGPNANNHNTFEMMISPWTTQARVMAEINQANTFNPLPAMPAGTIATPNFNGWIANVNPAHADARARIIEATFSNDAIGSRIQHSADLQNVVNTVLATITDKIKITTGIPTNVEGSTATVGYVISDNQNPTARLRTEDINIESRSKLTRSEIGQLILFTLRRKRNINQPGYCLLTTGGLPIEGWEDTINSAFNSNAPYQPTIGLGNDLIDVRDFALEGQNNRPGVLSNWIRSNFCRNKKM